MRGRLYQDALAHSHSKAKGKGKGIEFSPPLFAEGPKMRSLREALRLSRLIHHPSSCFYRPALAESRTRTTPTHNGGRSTEVSFSTSTLTSSSSTSSSTSLPDFSRVTDADLAVFGEILGTKGVVTDAETLQGYNTDWTGAFVGKSKLVLRPATTLQASAALAHLNSRRIAVVPQGGNTGLVGGGVPIADEVILSTDRLTEKKQSGSEGEQNNNEIVADATAMTLSAPAGTVLADLDARAASVGLAVPLDLGARGSCRIGGNVATNAGGPRVVRYGSLRSSVLGLEVVAADGTILDLGRPLRKDATGLDLKQLAIGSEGTLGLITRVTLAAPPRPPGPAALALLACPGWNEVLDLLTQARAALGESLSAAEFLDAESAALACDRVPGVRHPLPHCSSPYFVLLEAAGARPDHDEQRMAALLETALSSGAAVDGVRAASGREAEALWALREGVPVGLRHAGGKCFKYDVSLDVREMPLVVAEARRRVESVFAGSGCGGGGSGGSGGGEIKNSSSSSSSYSRDRVTVVAYGHLGDGNLHLNVSAPPEAFSGSRGGSTEGIAALASVLEPWVYRATAAARGSVSAEHGLGRMKAEHALLSKPAEALDLAASIKAIFDPRGILNPGKLLPREARAAAARRGEVIRESDEMRGGVSSSSSSSSSPSWKQWSVAEEVAAAASAAATKA